MLAPIRYLLERSSPFLAAVDSLVFPRVEGCLRGAGLGGSKALDVARAKGKSAFASSLFVDAIAHYTGELHHRTGHNATIDQH